MSVERIMSSTGHYDHACGETDDMGSYPSSDESSSSDESMSSDEDFIPAPADIEVDESEDARASASCEPSAADSDGDTDDTDATGRKRRRVDHREFIEGEMIPYELRRYIKSVRIRPRVKRIPFEAFEGCHNLTEVQFDEGATLDEIGGYAFRGCTALQRLTIPSSVTRLVHASFRDCFGLAEVRLHEGLEEIGPWAFQECISLRQVTIPSSVTMIGYDAFLDCTNLAELQLCDGSLRVIKDEAFRNCFALRSVSIPSSISKLENYSFGNCRNLNEVTFLGGERLLNEGFFNCGLSGEEGALNHERLNALIRRDVFRDCPLTTIKICTSWAISERIARLPRECRLSIEGRIRGLRNLELTQDHTVLACFPFDGRAYEEADFNTFFVQDTNNQTSESLHQALSLISFHELKEYSILVELAMWKTRLDERRARADCRHSVPGPAKSLIMEYCGYTSFLVPAIESV